MTSQQYDRIAAMIAELYAELKALADERTSNIIDELDKIYRADNE